MLKFKYDSKGDIPAGAEKFYSEKDGSFVLQAEGIKTEDDVQSVKDALNNERTKRRDAEKEAKDLKAKFSFLPDDFDSDEYNRLTDTSHGDVDERLRKQRETLTAQHKKESDAKDAVIAEKDDLIQKHVVEASLSKAIAENNIASHFVPAVEAMMKPKVKVEGTDVYLDEKPIAEAMKLWAESKDGSIYLAADNSNGGGSNQNKPNAGGSNVKTATRADFDAMNDSERMSFSKEGGKVVDQT